MSRHRDRQHEAGQPAKLTAIPRRRGREQLDDPSVATRCREAGGGGSQGGGGGRSALDEKKMRRG